MKNLLFIALMLTTLTGYATDITSIVPPKNVTVVQFNNVKKGHQLTIKDIEDVTLYNETIKSTGNYTKQFDLTTLENGSYTIELNKDSEVLTRSFNVKNGIVNLSTEMTFYKPVATRRYNQLFVSQLSSNEDVLDVLIYYNNKLVHQEVLSNSSYLKRVFQLSPDKKGEYFIIMKSAGKSFYKTFTL
ncbi:DUF3244 domain-containing protein [uncultured Nonlabens sp.]|uniref:DUF3244 domain-containing protein n=1 Tax=uncultured Nonlabens sp. TaxID=859306 RepID=UPI002605B79C|nr:DUF3244 domain-containing protein [uncultured Nonlabens sp.]